MPSRHRIVLSAFSCSPARGSEPGVGWNWAVGLVRAGYDVTVLTSTEFASEIEVGVASLGSPHLRVVYVEVPGDVRRHQGFRPLTGYFYLLLWQIAALRAARRLHAAHPFGSAHHITFGSIRSPSFLGDLGIPLTMGPLGGGESPPRQLRHHFPWQARVIERLRDASNALVRFDPLMRKSFASATRILVKTPESLAFIPKEFHAKSQIAVEIGIEPSALGVVRRTGAPTRLLFVGRQRYFKGMGLGLPAFGAAHRRNPALRLTMVGDGEERRAWQEQARSLGIADAIDWRGQVERTEVDALYRTHDVLLFPSVRDSSGNVIFEAAILGLPTICLDICGPGHLVGPDFGIKVAARDRSEAEVIDDLSRAITRLTDDRALWEHLSAGAREWSVRQTWSRRIAEIYGGEMKVHQDA
jgi:glycosyltransferase involved in cell wall biosynthesis